MLTDVIRYYVGLVYHTIYLFFSTEACRPGEYIGNDNRCHLCERGSYQPIERQQQPECLACPCVDDDCTANPITTLGEGKSELADCVGMLLRERIYPAKIIVCIPIIYLHF